MFIVKYILLLLFYATFIIGETTKDMILILGLWYATVAVYVKVKYSYHILQCILFSVQANNNNISSLAHFSVPISPSYFPQPSTTPVIQVENYTWGSAVGDFEFCGAQNLPTYSIKSPRIYHLRDPTKIWSSFNEQIHD